MTNDDRGDVRPSAEDWEKAYQAELEWLKERAWKCPENAAHFKSRMSNMERVRKKAIRMAKAEARRIAGEKEDG